MAIILYVERQTQGATGYLIDRLIRRTLRKSFRNLYWIPPQAPPHPAIYVPNHHGWHDGYAMYAALRELAIPAHLWMAELNTFPPFRHVGALPFPTANPNIRAATIRRSVRALRSEQRSLVLFAERDLHRPPEVRAFDDALTRLTRLAPSVPVIPVGIQYDMSIHQRPGIYISFGLAIEPGPRLDERTRLAVREQIDFIAFTRVSRPDQFRILVPGTPDVNERWDRVRRSVK